MATAPGLGQHSHGIALGLAVILLAVAGGRRPRPGSPGRRRVSAAEPASAGVAATGEVTRVTVTIQGMRFTPDGLRVPAGNTLQMTVVNSGDDVHDLVLETGERTPRLSPGQSATMEIAVVGRDLGGLVLRRRSPPDGHGPGHRGRRGQRTTAGLAASGQGRPSTTATAAHAADTAVTADQSPT